MGGWVGQLVLALLALLFVLLIDVFFELADTNCLSTISEFRLISRG